MLGAYSDVSNGVNGALRADYNGQLIQLSNPSVSQWFNTAAYAPPTATTGFCNYFGTAPRNSIEEPGKVQNNMALAKTMNLSENRSMEIRATIDNVFNTVQYTGINTTYGAPQFGQVSSVGQMRQFQFSARFRF